MPCWERIAAFLVRKGRSEMQEPLAVRSAGLPFHGARHTARARRAAVLVVVLVCLGVASIIFASLLRNLVSQHNAAQSDEWRVQAAWLAESGLERAANRLRSDAKYAGETWRIPADALGGTSGAALHIEVQTIPGQRGQRLVRVQADFPDGAKRWARQTRQAPVPVDDSRS